MWGGGGCEWGLYAPANPTATNDIVTPRHLFMNYLDELLGDEKRFGSDFIERVVDCGFDGRHESRHVRMEHRRRTSVSQKSVEKCQSVDLHVGGRVLLAQRILDTGDQHRHVGGKGAY